MNKKISTEEKLSISMILGIILVVLLPFKLTQNKIIIFLITLFMMGFFIIVYKKIYKTHNLKGKNHNPMIKVIIGYQLGALFTLIGMILFALSIFMMNQYDDPIFFSSVIIHAIDGLVFGPASIYYANKLRKESLEQQKQNRGVKSE
jgi:hypothetical protein